MLITLTKFLLDMVSSHSTLSPTLPHIKFFRKQPLLLAQLDQHCLELSFARVERKYSSVCLLICPSH